MSSYINIMYEYPETLLSLKYSRQKYHPVVIRCLAKYWPHSFVVSFPPSPSAHPFVDWFRVSTTPLQIDPDNVPDWLKDKRRKDKDDDPALL